jgi:hypothetical protein
LPSIIKVDQIQSDTGRVNVTSNLASVTISNNIEAPLKITTSYNEKVRLISATDAANEQQAIIGYNAGNYYWQLGAGKDSSNNPFVSIYTGTSGTSLSERLKVTGAGVVELLNGQLKFPATQNASSDANTLDDYEEGTWTPQAWQGSTQITSPTVAYGRYIKIGNVIWIGMYFYKSSGAPSASGQWQIRGLPFNVSAVMSGVNAATAGYNGVNGTQSTQIARWQANGSTFLELYGQYGTTSWTSSYVEFSFSGCLEAG